jgi:predicted Zn-dependent protease
MKRRLLHRLLPLLISAAVFGGCYTVPETGRKSLMLVPQSMETELGATSFTDLKTQRKVSENPEMNSSVRRVGNRISKVVTEGVMRDAKWEFVLFDDDTPNAFALPGGKVGVHTGLFKIAHTDDELAIVMGHEIAHVTARHGSERMSQGVLVAAGGVALDVALKDKDSTERNAWLAAYGAGATVGAILPFSRLNESEADEIGIKYAARAGYDPRAAVSFWQRMKEASEGKGKPPEWLSTHPADETRIKRLQQVMPKALEEYEKAKKSPATTNPPAPAG